MYIYYIYIYIYLLAQAGDEVRKWICSTSFSIFLSVFFAILFAVFFSLYIKLNGEYKDIEEENDRLEIANGKLIEENEILNNTLESLLKTREEEEVKEEEEEEDATPPTPPLLGIITVDSTKDEFRRCIWNSTGNSYEYNGSSMRTFGGVPVRGEINNRGIYVLPDYKSTNIGFYDLSSFGRSPVIRSQSGVGYDGTCGFMEDDIVICVTLTTGDIYKYNITNNYDQVRIPTNNPSGKGFMSVLITKEKQILAAYGGCIYIYNSSGAYIGYSDSLQTDSSMLQMKEVRSNIILTAEDNYVHSHDISDPENTIIYEFLDYDNTKTVYYTIEVLEGNTGDIAIGGHYNPSPGTNSGYVELFHLNEDNSALLPISNKRWVKDSNCYIYIIREIQTGVIIFGGHSNCAHICTWEYAAIGHKQPICFPLGGRVIYDIISP